MFILGSRGGWDMDNHGNPLVSILTPFFNQARWLLARRQAAQVTIAAAFSAWSAAFIVRSSFVGIDGRRHFSLFDDAMISMRYAWNLSHGHGLVWNVGQQPVEGFTNLLMTMVMALATLAFGQTFAVLAIQILGIALALAVASLAAQLTGCVSTEGRGRAPALLCFALALLYYPLSYWSLMGMETPLVALLLLYATISVLRFDSNRAGRSLLLGAAALSLAFLARPDTAIPAGILFSYALYSVAASTARASRRRDAAMLLGAYSLYTATIVAVGAFSLSYYHALLPNTYTLKLTGMPLDLRLANGIKYTLPFLLVTFPIFTVATWNAFTVRNRRGMLLLTLALSVMFYQIYVGGDPWNYWRMLSLAVMFVLPHFAAGLWRGADILLGTHVNSKAVSSLVVLASVCAMLLANVCFLDEMVFLKAPYTTHANELNVNTALAIRDVTTEDATVGVFWAGAIPYYSERSGIDFLGKSDKHVAQLRPDLSGAVDWLHMSIVPGHNKYDLTYSIQLLLPTYVQGFKWGQQDLTSWAEDYYVSMEYHGVPLFLRRDSAAVLWDHPGLEFSTSGDR